MTHSPLTPAQRAELIATLHGRQDQLARRLAEHQGGQSRVDHAREVLLQDGDDAPQRDAEREVDLALTDLETAELAAVERALDAAAGDRFGLCADCGDAIPMARLRPQPWALRCVACETARERRGAGTHPATI